jgi:rare lipoprotein A
MVACVVVGALMAGCAGQASKPTASKGKQQRSKEYFAESEYGVKASPRVSNKASNLPRGGGRDQVGKPYMVRGKMYYPKEEKNYRKSGYASWYGSAFHGRLTANGEIYDMTHLTAAHPTMPLPSYARVTNKANGKSVIVRVNDRGPYSNDRVIDLSKRAAELLDYIGHGTAKVDVQYVGRAPLHGQDDAYLMASYRPGNASPDPSDGLPTGVMIAMNGSSPSAPLPAELPGMLSHPRPSAGIDPVMTANIQGGGFPELPAFAPVAPSRPDLETGFAVAALSYAETRVNSATAAFAALEGRLATPGAGGMDAAGSGFVAAGTFAARADADALAETLSGYGDIRIEAAVGAYAVVLASDGRLDLDGMLAAAWKAGATDAIAVRD